MAYKENASLYKCTAKHKTRIVDIKELPDHMAKKCDVCGTTREKAYKKYPDYIEVYLFGHCSSCRKKLCPDCISRTLDDCNYSWWCEECLKKINERRENRGAWALLPQNR
jgi:hypothetical protein